jgi:hypothetical protein
MINLGEADSKKMVLQLDGDGWGDGSGDFYPGQPTGESVTIYDVYSQHSEGQHTGRYTVTVPPMDGRLFKVNFSGSVYSSNNKKQEV